MSSKLRSLLVLMLAMVLIAACSDDEPAADRGASALDRLVASAEATREAGTARIEQTVRMTYPEGGSTASGTVDVHATGFVDLRSRRGRMSVTTEGSGMAGADALGGDMEMILDGRAMYMKSDFYRQLASQRQPWLRVTYEELGERGISQIGQQDPLAFVEAMRSVYGEVEEAGSADVRGDATTRYRAAIDVERMLDTLPEETRGSVGAAFRQLGISRMPLEAWLDGDGRLRRMQLTSDGAEGAGVLEMSLELYDFGVAFNLRIPPPEQVAEFSEVFGELDSGG